MRIPAFFTNFDFQLSESNRGRLKHATRLVVVSAVLNTLAIFTFSTLYAFYKTLNTAITLTGTAKSGHDVLTSWFQAGMMCGASAGLGYSTCYTIDKAEKNYIFNVTKNEGKNAFDFVTAHLTETLFRTVVTAGIFGAIFTRYGIDARLLSK